MIQFDCFMVDVAKDVDQSFVKTVSIVSSRIENPSTVHSVRIKSNEETFMKKRKKKSSLKMKWESDKTSPRCCVIRFNEEPDYFTSIREYNDYLELIETVGEIISWTEDGQMR